MIGVINIDPCTYGHGKLVDECSDLGFRLTAYVFPVFEGFEDHVYLHATQLDTKMGFEAVYPVAEALIHGRQTATDGPRAQLAEAWIRKAIKGELNT